MIEDLRARGLRVFPVSAASGEGVRELTFAMAGIVFFIAVHVVMVAIVPRSLIAMVTGRARAPASHS